MAGNPPSTPTKTPANHQGRRMATPVDVPATPGRGITNKLSSFQISQSSTNNRPTVLDLEGSPRSGRFSPTRAPSSTSLSSWEKWINTAPTDVGSSEDEDELLEPLTPQQKQPSSTASASARRHRRAEVARHALDAYRTEPALSPPAPEILRTPKHGTIRGNPFTPEKKYRQPEEDEDGESPGRYPYGTIRGTSQRLQSPTQRNVDQPEQYQTTPRPLLLSRREPVNENIPTQPVNISARRRSAPAITRPLSLVFSPPRDVEQYRKYSVLAEPPKVGAINALTMRKQAIRNSQVTGILTSPVTGKISLDGISEGEAITHFGTPSTSPQTSPNRSPGIGLGISMPKRRVVSAMLSEDQIRDMEKEKQKQRIDHLIKGTWQQGRFRPPWDELTDIDGESDIGESTMGTNRRDPTLSPGLKYPGLVSPGPRRVSGGNRGSLDINKRGSVDISRPSLDLGSESGRSPQPGSYETPQKTPQFDENKELTQEDDDFVSFNEIYSVLPTGPPNSLHDKYLLEILAEHYFDTLQTHFAIYIYDHCLAPSADELNVQLVYPPRVATYFTLGQMFLSSQMFISALRAFKQATELDPFDIASQVQVGYVNFLLVDYEEAESAYRQALAGFRGSPIVNYRVLGLDASINKDDVVKSTIACKNHASGGGSEGVWGIASGKIYRVSEEKKRNLMRKKYFEAGRVVNRVVEIGKVGFGGKRESDLASEEVRKEDEDDDDSGMTGLKRMWSGGSMWSWASRGPPSLGIRGGGSGSRKSSEILERDDNRGEEIGGSMRVAKVSTRGKGKRRVSLDSVIGGFKRSFG